MSTSFKLFALLDMGDSVIITNTWAVFFSVGGRAKRISETLFSDQVWTTCVLWVLICPD